jgi:hypothetical protein
MIKLDERMKHFLIYSLKQIDVHNLYHPLYELFISFHLKYCQTLK